MKIDLIVMTYKPGDKFLKMVEQISHQSTKINKIIVYNTEQKYFERIMYAGRFLEEHRNMEIHHISKKETDLGKTKNMAVKLSDADYFLIMGQDVTVDDPELVAKLVARLEGEPNAALVYARQISGEDTFEAYRFFQKKLFPEESCVRTCNDTDELDWRAYFSSNQCAMYNRRIFDGVGGFGSHVILGEDILYAANAMNAGYKVIYAAEAVVDYSRVLEGKDGEGYFFDMAVSHVKHPEIYDVNNVSNYFRRMSKSCAEYLKKYGYRKELRRFYKTCGHIKKGYKAGLKFKRLSKASILKLSLSPEYWRIDELMKERSVIDSRAGYGRSEAELAMLKQPPVKHND